MLASMIWGGAFPMLARIIFVKENIHMDNLYYEKIILDNYKPEHLTLKDFIDICDTLKMPVFEVEIINNPFAEPHRTVAHHMYDSMSDYRKTMPEWSCREYDYYNDRPEYYFENSDIANGSFDFSADNKSSLYNWHFEVVGECVVVHSLISYID